MVYEKKCEECGRLIDFGGRESLEHGLPENAMEFDGKIYCKDCVKKFVQFGSDNLIDDVEELKEKIQELSYEMGFEMEFNF